MVLTKRYLYLQEINIPLISNEECSQIYGKRFDAETMFCAGDGLHDSCQGDSGGPLVCRERYFFKAILVC